MTEQSPPDERVKAPRVVEGVLLCRLSVPARPPGFWTLAIEDLTGYVRLKITCGDSLWRYTADGKMCTASGTRTQGAGCLCETASVGTLVGKFGGSNADDTSSVASVPSNPTGQAAAALAALSGGGGSRGASNVFVVGQYTDVALPSGFNGSLFLTMNDRVVAFDGHDGALTVEIRGVSAQQIGT